jgi:recombinational DNA repair protein (RecF pathway)
MIVGYLVPHRCPNDALAACVKCGKSFCDEHVSITQSGLLCLACQQGLDQPVAVSQVARDYTSDDIAAFASVGASDRDDTFSDLS